MIKYRARLTAARDAEGRHRGRRSTAAAPDAQTSLAGHESLAQKYGVQDMEDDDDDIGEEQSVEQEFQAWCTGKLAPKGTDMLAVWQVRSHDCFLWCRY